MSWQQLVTYALLVIEYGLKILAIGTVPENRRPSSSSAWLLLILFVPVVGFPLYWLIGSPYVHGRRAEIQRTVNREITQLAATVPALPTGVSASAGLASIVEANRTLTGLPLVPGQNLGLFNDTQAAFTRMAEAIDEAQQFVHVEFYIMAWDFTTDPFFAALQRAAARGVTVRLLLDQLGSRKYPGYRTLGERLDQAGIEWHLMMPIDLLHGRWRRPDLRNHRKLLVIDNQIGFVGSHNIIDPAYGSTKNERIGRRWHDVSVEVAGAVVPEINAVFVMDWFTETGEDVSERERGIAMLENPAGEHHDPHHHAMQVVPSGPGYPSEPNAKLFISLIHLATRKVSIVSPYFVPDESLLTAITTACYRGLDVELFVGAEADQFIVGHAQRSYYRALLEAGVRIWLYPAPLVLHAKYLVIDESVAVIGSSNMDYRSFCLDYEIMLMAFGGDLVDDLEANSAGYRAASTLLTSQAWSKLPWHQRYIDNVCRLTSALM